MALVRNLGVKLRGSLCDALKYVSAQPLVFLDLAKNCSFMNWKLIVPTLELMDGHYLIILRSIIFKKSAEKFWSSDSIILIFCIK